MKKHFILIIFFFLSLTGMSQPCLLQGIQFTRQSEVDSFPITYPNCTQIEGNVIIGNFVVGSDITNLNGLNSITAINGRLTIFYTNYLTNLTGLDALVSIGSDLVLQSNNALTSLTGLSSLTAVGGYIDVYANNALTNFSGLEALNNVGSDISIYYNNFLTSLTGLENIEAGSIDGLFIWENSLLETCEVLSVCNYIANPGGDLHIFNNSTGCNSEAEVEDACEIISVDQITNDEKFSIYPNPASDQITFRISDHQFKNEIRITLFDLFGRPVASEIVEKGNAEITIDTRKLAAGLYCYRIMQKQRSQNGKIVILR